MNAYLAPTHNDWFRYLADRHAEQGVDEVNFWYPKPWGGRFGVLTEGQPLLFKLKRPHNHIAGGGFFKHYTTIPMSRAWEFFGEKNGARSYQELWQRITGLRRERPRPWEDPEIGCVLLVEPFFWPEERWIPDPPGWHRNIQRGRTYDLRKEEGRRIWEMVVERLQETGAEVGIPGGEGPTVDLPGGYSDPVRTRRRMGQGTFRSIITDLYERAGAITRERALPALEAAHIRPFSDDPSHDVRNGILLRSDVHRLFDSGYVTVTPEYRVEVSRRVKSDFNDGKNYLKLHGSEVWVPESEEVRPDPDVLEWHNENRFRG